MIDDWIIEETFFTTERWSAGKESLNISDINLPPDNFRGSQKEWIKELTTFIFLYPTEWLEIYSEYLEIRKKRGILGKEKLEYFRDEEGYLRKEGEKDIFLRIRLENVSTEVRKVIETCIEKQEILTFEEYISYCSSGIRERKRYLKKLYRRIVKKVSQELKIPEKYIQMNLSFEYDYNDCSFTGDDFYIDVLNDTYAIL